MQYGQCVAMPAFIAPSASMAAQDECAPLCAIEGMFISHLPLRGDHRSLQSRRCSLIMSICTTKAITDCCSKTRIRTCTHMHMHNHMFINYGIEGDRRSLPLPALRSKASVRTCTHMHMHTHKQHTHTRTTKAITDRFLYHLVFRSKGKHSHMHAHAHAHTCLSTM